MRFGARSRLHRSRRNTLRHPLSPPIPILLHPSPLPLPPPSSSPGQFLEGSMASSFRPRNSVGSGGAGAGAGAGSKLNSSSNSQNQNGNQNGNLPTGGNSARFNNINPRQSLGNSANNPSNAANSNNGTSSPRWGLNASNSNSPNPHHQPQANPTAFPSLTSSSTGTVDTQALMRERMLFLIVSLVVSTSHLPPLL